MTHFVSLSRAARPAVLPCFLVGRVCSHLAISSASKADLR